MNERFKEVANDYVNTGGHCMVDISTFYDKQDKRLLYMLVGCDWMTLSTFDHVSNDVPNGVTLGDYIVYSIEMGYFTTDPCWDNIQMLEMPEEYFDLFNYGMLSYIRNKFEYDHQLTRCQVDALPVELRNKVTEDYDAWLKQEDMLVNTDGREIIIDDRYAQLFYDSNGEAAVKFKQLLEKLRAEADIDDDHCDDFNNSKIHLIIDGSVFTLGMCAAVWNGLVDYARYIISEQ